MKKFILAVLMISSTLSFAKITTLDDLSDRLAKNGANWKAGPTSVSQLSDSEIRRMLGSLDVPNGSGLFYENIESNDSFDWRNVGGFNWLGPIMSQGNCGSCVAFATVATLEAKYRINANLPWLVPTFSPQHLFDCGGGYCFMGWFPGSAAKFVQNSGVVDEACSPYVSGATGKDLRCSEIQCTNMKERTLKSNGTNRPSTKLSGSAGKVKEALKRGPLMTTMIVYDDFVYYKSGIYKSVSKKSVGGHAVSLVGFDDEKRYWIIRNSWGVDWGEAGYAKISYDDKSGIAESTWEFELKKDNRYLSVQSPKDRDYLSGDVKLLAKSTYDGDRSFEISSSDQKYSLRCESVTRGECATNFDTKFLKDGRYEIVVNEDGKRSQVREFYVLNQRPEMKIIFSSDENDLTKPLSGFVEFEVKVESKPILPKRVVFVVLDINGNEVARKATEHVVADMKLGFRTTTVPNGEYQVFYRAEIPFQSSVLMSQTEKVVIKVEN